MKNNLTRTFSIDLMIFAVLVALMLMEPSMDWGRSLSLGGLLIHLGTVVVSVILASGCVHAAILLAKQRTETWGYSQQAGYGLLTVLLALGLTTYSFKLARQDDVLTEEIAAQKVEYFCFIKFKHDLCLSMVNNYPQAALRIEKWKRDVMVDRLKYYRQYYPKTYISAHKIDLKARTPSGKR